MRPFRCLIMGSPGSGKGTQSKRITTHFNIASLSSGDLLRSHIQLQTDIGLKVKSSIEKGELVSDALISSLIFKSIHSDGFTTRNWMLDGYPRTTEQAKSLDVMLESNHQKIDLVLNLDVPENVIVQRIIDRWIHSPSGRIYNMSFNPPAIKGLDDITGEVLVKRKDDNVEIFVERIKTYHSLTEPLLEYYDRQGKLLNFKGEKSDEITPLIIKVLEKILERR